MKPNPIYHQTIKEVKIIFNNRKLTPAQDNVEFHDLIKKKLFKKYERDDIVNILLLDFVR